MYNIVSNRSNYCTCSRVNYYCTYDPTTIFTVLYPFHVTLPSYAVVPLSHQKFSCMHSEKYSRPTGNRNDAFLQPNGRHKKMGPHNSVQFGSLLLENLSTTSRRTSLTFPRQISTETLDRTRFPNGTRGSQRFSQDVTSACHDSWIARGNNDHED